MFRFLPLSDGMTHTTLLAPDGTVLWMSATPGPPIEKVIGTKLWQWADLRERNDWRRYIAEAVLDGHSGPHTTLYDGRKYHCSFRRINERLIVNTWGLLLPTELSERERAVLTLIAQDVKPQQIAKKLRLSLSTVETYRARLKEKLKVQGTAGLIRWAVRVGLVPL
jgi:DNA-binding CsgD family transcriptional regulator